MERWFIGVDGGGTKTAFAISEQTGKPVLTLQRTGCSYMEIGIDGVIKLLKEGVHTCLEKAGLTIADCEGACFGIPCWGENPQQDNELAHKIQSVFAPLPVHIVNDGELGCAGALGGQEGIHIVSGTGAIAFGRGADNQIARCGGWNEFFGDEGSCYWIGREAMSLFSKEADGRLPKGPLYEIVKKELGLSNDFEFIDYVVQQVSPYRDKVAAFQRYAFQAAEAGDTVAQNLYVHAAEELAQMVFALKRQLVFSANPVPVTYSGGLFQTRSLILDPLRQMLEQGGCNLQTPQKTALEGALIIAIEQFSGR